MYLNQQISLLPDELKEVQKYGFYWKGAEVFLADWYWNSATDDVKEDYKKRAMTIYIVNSTGNIIQTIKGSIVGGIQSWLYQTAKTQVKNVEQGIREYVRQQTSMPAGPVSPPVITIPEVKIPNYAIYFVGALAVLGLLFLVRKKEV
jgi:hypothetical protein